jgi:hypothetical protein
MPPKRGDVAVERGVRLNRPAKARSAQETLAVLLGVISVGIFIAHAIDSYRS